MRFVVKFVAGMDPGFQAGGAGDKRNFFFSNTHPYSINKLSIKTNIQKSLFLNRLRYNHLPTKTKDIKKYYLGLALELLCKVIDGYAL